MKSQKELPKIPDNLGMPVSFSAQLGFGITTQLVFHPKLMDYIINLLQ